MLLRSALSGLRGGMLALLLMAQLPMALAEERASADSVAIAATLLGSVLFVMCLFYMVNHPDKDVKKYTYQTICSTCSIFCAVLIFSTCNDMVQTFYFGGEEEEEKYDQRKVVVVYLIVMLCWYLFLQFVLAWISGAIGSPPESLDSMRIKLKSYAILLAHVVGFASINAWGAMQQMKNIQLFGGDENEWVFTCIVGAFLAQLLLQSFTGWLRRKVALGDDGKWDKYERLWAEETTECENDIMGLTLSFMFTQACRCYITGGSLPNREGKEPWDLLTSHTLPEIFGLGSLAALFLFLSILACVALNYFEEKEKEEKAAKEGGAEGHAEAAEQEHGSEKGSESGSEGEEGEESSGLVRTLEVMAVSCSMVFAWDIFFSAQWYFPSQTAIGTRNSDMMLLSVVIAMFFSLCSFAVICGLDKVADRVKDAMGASKRGKMIHRTIVNIIGFIGILIGFSWEQCFDKAIEDLSSTFSNPHIVKLILAAVSIVLIVPAWKNYILPMVVMNGYEFGFVIDGHNSDKWDKVLEKLEQIRKLNKVKRGEPEQKDLAEPLLAEENNEDHLADHATIDKLKMRLQGVEKERDDMARDFKEHLDRLDRTFMSPSFVGIGKDEKTRVSKLSSRILTSRD